MVVELFYRLGIMRRNIMASVGLIGLGIVLGVMLISNYGTDSISKLFADEYGAKNPPVATQPAIQQLNNAFNAVSEAVTPTVVSISVEMESDEGQIDDRFGDFFRFFREPDNQENQPRRRSMGSGSGVIISEDGYIVTNNHVIENAIDEGITVITHDRKEYKKAELIGSDPLTDLALIKIDAKGLQPAHFSNMSDVKVGDFVLAVGNPLGLNSTVTAGIISAIGRGQLSMNNRDRYSIENYIQTDAAINPGNSGGGLFSLNGSLVGINTAIATRTGTYIGYGFAIPVDMVKAVIDDLIDDGKINRGYIGVSIRSVDEAVAKAVGLDEISGVLVHNVLEGGAAEKAGIEPGDVILEIDGKKVETSNELQSQIVFRRAGDKVKLTIWRDDKKITKTVTLMPKDEDVAESSLQKGGDSGKKKNPAEPVKFDNLGFSVEPLNDEIKEKYDVSNGVFVTKVERYSPAQERGLFPNGVIVKADRKKVDSPGKLKDIIDSKKAGDAILLQVKYKDSFQIVALEIQG